MSTDISINKPEPQITNIHKVVVYTADTEIKPILKLLEAGKHILVTEVYSNGAVLLKELQERLKRTMPVATFEEQRTYRAAYQKLSNLILIEVANHTLNVKKAPAIGWLEKLYPETPDFLLPFPQVQGLNSSWQWYTNGIAVPVLRNKLHPYYGTYFPTRFDHLILFDNWLKRYDGPKKAAYDIGIGSGVLSFQLVKYGFQKVFGTDINPNVIVGLAEFMGETKLSRKIELDHVDLFGKRDKPAELIVFNPPWLPAEEEQHQLDAAIYYTEDLFEKFFAAAKTRLLPDGKLVIVFSNLAQVTNVTKAHPIKKELSKGGRFELEICLTRKVKAASELTKRDQNWREEEEVELWILNHKN